jgi:hypothetical protein
MHRLLFVLTFGSILTFSVFAFQANEVPDAGVPASASREAQASQASLTNKDVIELLHAGLTPEIVIAKIKSTSCDFDTSPDVLKQLKVANVPDAVILAMVQVPRIQTVGQVAAPSNGARGYVKCGVNGTEVYLLDSPAQASVVAKMKCGDNITLLSEQAGYYTARTEDGAEGYISRYFVSPSKETTTTPIPSMAPSTSGKVGHVQCGANGTGVYLVKSPTYLVKSPTDPIILSTMKCGDSLTLLSDEDGYYKARTKDGAEGYVPHVFV